MSFERIEDGGRILAYVISGDRLPSRTTFITPPDEHQQVGYIVYARGGEIPRHYHKPVRRTLEGTTTEVLVVQSGLCEVDVYGDDRRVVATRRLKAGDALLLVAGGHGFRVLEDTVLLEVKQGPYLGVEDKERF